MEKARPVEFAGGRDVAVADDIATRDAVAARDVMNERDQCFHLGFRKVAIAPFMAGIDDLDADARRIDVGDPAPPCAAGMPCAFALVDHADGLSVLGHDIMRGNLAVGAGEPADRALGIGHPGIVQHEHRDGQRTLVEIGRWCLDHCRIKSCCCTFPLLAEGLLLAHDRAWRKRSFSPGGHSRPARIGPLRRICKRSHAWGMA